MKPSRFKSLAGLTMLAGSFLGCTEIHPLYISSFLEDLTNTQPSTPLVGTWRERTPLSCDGKLLDNQVKFGELVFKRGGTFSFTWFPFESYVDCVGTYSYNIETNDLSLTVTDGFLNSFDANLTGKAYHDPNNADNYILDGFSFGIPVSIDVIIHNSEPVKFERPCGYIIER